MPSGWSVWLTDHNGRRLADLSANQGFEFVKHQNAVGSFDITLEQGFDDTLLGKDYRVEIWRDFDGESRLLFAGLVHGWENEGTDDPKLRVSGACLNHLLKRRVIVSDVDLGSSYIFAGTQSNDTFQISDDNGATLTSTGTPGQTTYGVHSCCLAADGSIVVTSGSNTGGEVGKIHRSTDGGTSWTLVHSAAVGDRYAYAIVKVPDTGTLVATIGSGTGRILRSVDNGATWAETYNHGGGATFPAATVAANGDILVGRTGAPPTVYRSTDRWRHSPGRATCGLIP